jgi:hypothetical protein
MEVIHNIGGGNPTESPTLKAIMPGATTLTEFINTRLDSESSFDLNIYFSCHLFIQPPVHWSVCE